MAKIRSREINIFDRSVPAWKIIMAIAWPVIMENVMQIMVSYVDTAMVGSLGVDAQAAVSVNSPFINFTNGFVMGIAAAFSVLVSRAIGEGRPEYAREVVRQSVFMTLFLGTALSLFWIFVAAPNLGALMNADESIRPTACNYLRILGCARLIVFSMIMANNIHRAVGDTKIPMFSNICNNVVNVILNFLFIYQPRDISFLGMKIHMWGAGWGVEGAAIATAIAATVSAVLTVGALFTVSETLKISIKDKYKLDMKIQKDALALGLPMSFDRMIITGGQMVMTRLLAGLGNAVLAANSFANVAESMCYMPVMGFSVSATTLVAQSLGANDLELAEKYRRKTQQYAITVMTFLAVAMYILAPQLISFFSKDAEVIAMGAGALRIQAFAEPCFAYASVAAGILKGAGDAKYSMVVSVCGMWIVRVMLATLLISRFGWSLNGVWFPMALDWLTRSLVFGARLRSGKWKTAWSIKH